MKVLSSRYPYRGRIVSVRVDTVELPQGTGTTVREVVEHPGAVAILALDGEKNVVLVRQYRHPAGGVLLEVPAGKLEPGEDPLACARRELAEEAGLGGVRWRRLACCYPSPGFCNELLYIYEARELESAPGKPDEDENIELVRMPVAEARRMAASGEIADAKTLIALLLSSPPTA